MKMKRNFFIVILVFFALAVFVSWLLRNNASSLQKPAQEPQKSISQIGHAPQITNVGSIQSNVINAPPAPPQTNSTSMTWDERKQAAVQSVLQQNKAVDFWGKVVDQDGQAISGVQIVLQVRHWHYNPPADLDSDFPKYEMTTDADGKFKLSGVTGDVLELESMQKNNYRLSPRTPHSLGTSGGSLEQPVIFKMWKEGAKQLLVTGSHVFGIDLGKIYTLDLIQGEKFVGETVGDLRVSITRASDAKPREKYQWSFSIEAIGGGLLESDDEFMYLAPESGYEPKIEMQLDPDNSDWKGEITKQFFIRARNGQVYGRVQVTIYSIYNVHSAIEVNYAINPNGSRNLQP